MSSASPSIPAWMCPGPSLQLAVDGAPSADNDNFACPGVDPSQPDFACLDPATAVAGVRCCMGTGDAVVGASDCTVDGVSVNCMAFTYDDALDRCASMGAGWRLCTPAELFDDVARGTGCYYDRMRVWAEDVSLTDEPTLMPTPEPGFACPQLAMQLAVDGSPNYDFSYMVCDGFEPGFEDMACVDATTPAAGCRCCHGQGHDVIGASDCNVDGVNVICMGFTYDQAVTRCENMGVGWRLCTAEELFDDVARGTGCK